HTHTHIHTHAHTGNRVLEIEKRDVGECIPIAQLETMAPNFVALRRRWSKSDRQAGRQAGRQGRGAEKSWSPPKRDQLLPSPLPFQRASKLQQPCCKPRAVGGRRRDAK